MPIELVAIHGSARPDGNSRGLLEEALAAALVTRPGLHVQVVRAYEAGVDPCIACGGCYEDQVGCTVGGDGWAAIEAMLRSADALRSVSPYQVASGLLNRARMSLRRIGELPSYSQEELAQIRRLTSGAEEAFADGDYPRAIRRAYYACQLLGADPS